VSEPGATAPAVAGPGALLKAERERRGLSLPDVAESLHVDPRLAAALEGRHLRGACVPTTGERTRQSWCQATTRVRSGARGM